MAFLKPEDGKGKASREVQHDGGRVHAGRVQGRAAIWRHRPIFVSWLASKGLDQHGAALRAKLEREYERGVVAPPSRRSADDLNRSFLSRQSSGRPKSATFKGRKIDELPDGSWVVPSIDRESHFDSLEDAKRFVSSWKKNPVTDRAHRYNNPAKFDRCIKEVKAKGGDVNAYAVCTAAGTRNPDNSADVAAVKMAIDAGRPIWLSTYAGRMGRPRYRNR